MQIAVILEVPDEIVDDILTGGRLTTDAKDEIHSVVGSLSFASIYDIDIV